MPCDKATATEIMKETYPDYIRAKMKEASPTITITAVWTRRIGDHVETLVETGGQWRQIGRAHVEGSFSEIVEAAGMVDNRTVLECENEREPHA